EDRAQRGLLRRAQPLPQRRLLFRHHLPGDGLPGRDVPGALRDPAHRRLARAVGGDARGPRAEDRASAAGLHGLGRAGFRADRRPRGSARRAAGAGSTEGRPRAPLLASGDCIDLRPLDLEGAIACYLIDHAEPTIVDPGPTTCLERLEAELRARGIGPDDLRHVVLTHVHLDHAGAAGHLLERFPRAVVLVHEDGAPHMADPTRLVASTRRTFGEAHDRLWGEVRAVPRDRLRAWRPGERGP